MFSKNLTKKKQHHNKTLINENIMVNEDKNFSSNEGIENFETNKSVGKSGRNANLHKAHKLKNDEFYTQFPDIRAECDKYSKYFKDKVIYCNCDDHYGIGKSTPKSNFIKYFADNFQAFGLKKVIATHYENSGKSTAYILNKDNTGNKIICFEDILEIPLKGNGDFRSEECIKFLEESDIVITNPPFSLFREYVEQLIKYKKKFLIIGNDNCRTYKEIFPLLKDNLMWIGYNHVKSFMKTNGDLKEFGNVGWYTNLPCTKRNETINTKASYKGHEKDYPKYDNYDAIEVSRVNSIPMDYEGVMGVPITFLDKYNPSQMEIIKFRKGDDDKDLAYIKTSETRGKLEREREFNHTSESSFVIVGTSDRGGDGEIEFLKLPHKRYDAPVVGGKGIYKRIFIKLQTKKWR
jgi:hypothetical protein